MIGSDKSQPTMFLLTMAALVVVVAGLKAAQDIVIPFLLSGFIAIICGPAGVIFRTKTKNVLACRRPGFALAGAITLDHGEITTGPRAITPRHWL